MIVVSNKELEARLDKAWQEWLVVCAMLSKDALSQVKLDEEAVRRFENIVSNLGNAAARQMVVAGKPPTKKARKS
jgi:hypothetical protein